MEEQFEQFEQKLKLFSGYITQPELRYSENGKCKCTFGIPLKKSKDSEPIWLNCECWDRKAEEIGNKFKKGDEVLIMGYFKESKYEDKEGKIKTKIIFIIKGIL